MRENKGMGRQSVALKPLCGETLDRGYSTYDELKQYTWRDLRFYVQEFNPEQISYLRSAIYNDISDTPEKRQKLSTTSPLRPSPVFFCISSVLDSDSDLRCYYEELLRLEEKNEEVKSVRADLGRTIDCVKRLRREEQELRRLAEGGALG